MDVLDPFKIFSKYTPLKPLVTHPVNTATRPINRTENDEDPLLLLSPLGHCEGKKDAICPNCINTL